MANILNTIGEKISSFFSEPDLGVSSSFRKEDPLLSSFQKDSFCENLPYLGYDEKTEIFINKSSLGFVIEVVPLVGASDSSKKEIQSLFDEILEEGDSLQLLLWADHRIDSILKKWENGSKTSNEVVVELGRKRREFFKNNPPQCCRQFRFILSYSVATQNESLENGIKKLDEKKKRVLKILTSMTHARSWDVKKLLNVVDGMVCFNPSSEEREFDWNPYQSISSQFNCSGKVRVKKDGLEWDNDEVSLFKSFQISKYPQHWSLDAMQMLIGDVVNDSYRINDPFFLQYAVYCPKQSKEESKFWQKSQIIENQGRSASLLRMIPELAQELSECDAIRRSVKKGSRFVWTQFSAGLWSSKERMTQSSQVLTSLFRINSFTIQESRFLHLPQFISTLPMSWASCVKDLKELNLLKTTITPECGNLVPIQGEWAGTRNPGMLLVGRRGQILNWNPFDNRSGNYNVSVVGRSGSGKSVFMQDLLLAGLRTGAKVFVLEVGRSFEKMADILGGQQIHFSQSSHICLNPFSNLPQDKDEMELEIAMIKSIVACMASPNQGVSDYELALIEKAIRYACGQKNATITHVSEWLQQQEDIRSKTLGVMLTPYTKDGVYGKHFEGKNNVNFHNQLVLVELEELKEKKDLQSVVLQVFVMAITNQAFLGDRKTPFYICIDEAWDLLRGPQTGIFIETLARRLRKYNGSLVVGTQSIDDFFATPGAKAAFENSDWLCMLTQKMSSVNQLGKSGKLDLTESKKRAIESLKTVHGEFSEVMIMDADGNYSISRLIVDPFSLLLYSTNAQEYSRIKDYKNKGYPISEAINMVLEERKKKR